RLLYRAYRTLRTPVSNLIDTLGVEVPDAPEVTLAGLKSNACTIRWSRPGPGAHKAVAKYLIQVNGVNVGESSRLETAIEVTGLKPGHFYNVRVIAVGGNHFQAGSAVLRLSTLCKDGRPQQGHSGPPSTKDEDDQDSESNEETQTGRGHGVEIQAATLPESPQIPMVREHSGGHPGGGSQAGQRRNTGGRKHSPSTAAADQAARERAIANVPEESMQQLTEKFEHTRKDTEDTAVTIAKESEDFKVLFSDLTKDRDAKKQLLKDKEEQSEKVKKEASNAERLNRTAQNKRKQREKVLQEKKLERDKWRGDIAKWKREIESMRNEQKTWREEKEQIGKVKEDKISEIQTKITEQQLILEGLENDLHIRGRQIRDLEADRMQPGAEDDEESKAREANDRKEEAEWQAIERTLVPRPLSIASSDLPRPSTDSAPFGWGPTQDSLISRNSPLATNWSVHMHPAPPTWSRNPSRRPSIQHGSSSALTTGIASDDDEFLPSSDSFAGPVSPPSAGVIGTRPVSSHKPPTPKLNPAAPAFQKLGLSFTSKSNKGKAKAKAIDSPTSPEDPPPHDSTNLSSPAASRKSRDAHSIRTQNSMAESHESLDRAASNTTSEFPSGSSSKEKESSAFRQLLRKGSSSKFSISSFRSKENGLFSGKKGVSSTPNSDRGLGDHRDNSFDEYGEDAGLGRSVDSVTSSPMIGSTGSGEWKGKEKEAGTPKEGRMSVGWGRFISKKGKGRESSEVERSEAEVTGDEA
ncbi:hypothetical protein BKA61DRAFT_487471, partial [Leptodontidium sp. MPI-SDFR-AT-0119]